MNFMPRQQLSVNPGDPLTPTRSSGGDQLTQSLLTTQVGPRALQSRPHTPAPEAGGAGW